ncbi:MAG TPA: hypothetical protein VFF06_34520 [Polyangia bacterium]|nr:hypothetical protein [Polyangia bacterium]
MKLSLECAADDNSTVVTGEVYAHPVDDTARPIVNMVVARNSYSALFSLPAGSWVYHFHVEGAGGQLTLTLKDLDDNATPIASKIYDTRFGYYGKVFLFAVPA